MDGWGSYGTVHIFTSFSRPAKYLIQILFFLDFIGKPQKTGPLVLMGTVATQD